MYNTLLKVLIFVLFSCFWRNVYFCPHICARIRPEYLPLYLGKNPVPSAATPWKESGFQLNDLILVSTSVLRAPPKQAVIYVAWVAKSP